MDFEAPNNFESAPPPAPLPPTQNLHRQTWIIVGIVLAVIIVGVAVALGVVLSGVATPSTTTTYTPTITVQTTTLIPLVPADVPPPNPDPAPVPGSIQVVTSQFQFIPFGSGFVPSSDVDFGVTVRRCVLGPLKKTLYVLADKVYVVNVQDVTNAQKVKTFNYNAIDLVISPDNLWLYLVTEDVDQRPTFVRISLADPTKVTSVISPFSGDDLLLTAATIRLILSKDTRYLFCIAKGGPILGQITLDSFSKFTFDSSIFSAFSIAVDIAVSPENEKLVVLASQFSNPDSTSLLMSKPLNVTTEQSVSTLNMTGATAVETNVDGSIAYVGFQINGKPAMAAIRISDGAELGRSTIAVVVNAPVTAIRRVGDRLFAYFDKYVADIPINGPYNASFVQLKSGNVGFPSQSFLLKTV